MSGHPAAERRAKAEPGSPAWSAGELRGREAFAEQAGASPLTDKGADGGLRDGAETAASYRRGWSMGYCLAEEEARRGSGER